jgi:RsiW-degrading membrane proteinase PrsW (M82 family)
LQLIFEQTLSTMPRPETGFAASLYGNFNIGLCEELAKAIPALIGLAIALQPAQPAGAPPQNGPFEWLKCSSPLDGVLIGVAAGIAFTSLETLHQYVPDVINKAKASGDAAGVAKGFALLIPRLLDAVIGHSAWAGVSGYFIGLATRYPKKIVMLLAIGWVVPAALHGFWDAMTHLGEMALFKKVIWVAGAVNLLLFVACLLKAKQLYATEMGGASTDSIIIGAPAGAAWASPAPVAAPQQQAFAPQPPPFSPPPPQQPAPPPQHVAPAATAPAVPPVPKFALANGANRFGVLVGQTIDLAALFPGCGLPASCLAEVNAHPNDASIVGLKNLTGDTWVVQFETGAMTSVGPGRNVKLVDKAKIVIGGATVEVQQI